MNVEVFLGDLTDPSFNYEGGDWSGNTPRRIGNYFPRPNDIFFQILDMVEKKIVDGRQTDWGSWTVRLYPHEMVGVVRNLYGEEACAKEKSVKDLHIHRETR